VKKPSDSLRNLARRFPAPIRRGVLAPSESLSPIGVDQTDRNLHLVTIHGLLNSAALNMVAPFVAIFAMKIGATRMHVAFLTSAPAVVSLVAMIPGAWIIDRSNNKKRLTYLFMLGHRIFYLLLATTPLFVEAARPTAFVVLLALMNLPGAVSNVAWQSFASRVVPPSRRAEVFAARSRLMSIVGTIVTIVMGLFLDRASFPVGYQIAFAGAFLVAMLELTVFKKTRDADGTGREAFVPKAPASPAIGGPYPPLVTSSKLPVVVVRLHRGMKVILAEKQFVRFTLASVLFYLAWQMPWPLFSWYQVRELHANNVWVSVLSLMNTGGALFGYGFWSRRIRAWGNLKTLAVATLPIFITCIVNAFSRQLYTIAAANLVVGAIFAGVNIALFNTLLEVAPDHQKTSYIAYFNTAVTISAIAAPILGISLLNVMDFREAFLVTAAIRVLGALVYLSLYRRERLTPSAGAGAP
jgi:MFS family permease